MDAHTVLILEHKGEEGTIGEICLNRPSACHALTAQMARTIANALRDWYHRPDLIAIILRGKGEHFCAGGDLRKLYDSMGREAVSKDDLFLDEYRLFDFMHAYPKPIIAFLSGYVLGAGVGLAAQARFRVMTHSVQWGMPELNIGLFPDVGSRYFLRRISDPLAVYMAMSGARLSVSDLSFIGLLDYVADLSAFDAIRKALVDASWGSIRAHAVLVDEKIAAILSVHQLEVSLGKSAVNDTALAVHHKAIFSIFSNISQSDALNALRLHSDWGKHLAQTIEGYSPTVRAWVWHLFREAPIPDTYRLALLGDYHASRVFLNLPDFKEGIRACIIDKDHAPSWAKAHSDLISESIEKWRRCFAQEQEVIRWIWA
jgi:enoyl-CoA hydratase/carnithine racemase